MQIMCILKSSAFFSVCASFSVELVSFFPREIFAYFSLKSINYSFRIRCAQQRIFYVASLASKSMGIFSLLIRRAEDAERERKKRRRKGRRKMIFKMILLKIFRFKSFGKNRFFVHRHVLNGYRDTNNKKKKTEQRAKTHNKKRDSHNFLFSFFCKAPPVDED